MVYDFKFKGFSLEELQKMSLDEFAELMNSRAKRNIKRNKDNQLYQRIQKSKKIDKDIRTHYRDMIVIPKMVGKNIFIYNGKEFKKVFILPEMLGHYLGEFSFTRKRVKHGKAGIGATKSSTAISARK